MNINRIREDLAPANNVPFYYFPFKNRYLLEDQRGHFIQYPLTQAKNLMKSKLGYNTKQVEDLMVKICDESVVDDVIPIGGMKKGLLETEFNQRILVPSEQTRIIPQSGDWSTINAIYSGMLGEVQFEYYKGWLKTWLSGFYEYKFVPGQVLVLIGETASGKTLVKNIHNHIFGGGGQPIKYMTGKTNFNGELCAVCSLHIDDKLNELDYKGKMKLKAECKELAVAGQARFEFKKQTAFTASPIQRLLICCNANEDSVSIIPDLDGSTKNKVSILYCRRKEMPMPTSNVSDKKAFWQKIESEIPAFINHLINEHEITEKFEDNNENRMGVRGYHNKKALSFIRIFSNEGKRLHAIIEALREFGDVKWEGSASDLKRKLEDSGIEIYSTPTSLGKFLNQRIDCGEQLIERIGHRRYKIDLRYHEDLELEDLELEDELCVDALIKEPNLLQHDKV